MSDSTGKQRMGEKVVLLLILAGAVYLYTEAQSLSSNARLFPEVVLGLIILLTSLRLLTQFRFVHDAAQKQFLWVVRVGTRITSLVLPDIVTDRGGDFLFSDEGDTSARSDQELPPLSREITSIVWLAVFLATFILFGIYPLVALVAVYIYAYSSLGITKSILVSAFALVFVYILFTVILGAEFHHGIVPLGA